MPRYKRIDTGMKMLPIDLSVQLLPGTFEHALSHLIDHELDLRVFDERFRNRDREKGLRSGEFHRRLRLMGRPAAKPMGNREAQLLGGPLAAMVRRQFTQPASQLSVPFDVAPRATDRIARGGDRSGGEQSFAGPERSSGSDLSTVAGRGSVCRRLLRS